MSEPVDPFAALGALAPAVDMPASRELFDRSRSAPGGARTRWLLPAAVVTLLIAGLVGVWAIARDDDSSTIPVSPAAETAGYQVLLVAQSRSGFEGDSGTIDVATDDESFAAVLEPLAESGDLTVDFGRSIVAVFTIAGNACPPEIGGFDVDGATWTPRFVYGTEPCDDVGLTWAYVVAFDRDGLGASISLTLPPDTLDGFTGGLDAPGPEHWEVIAVEETSLPFGTILAATDEVEAGRFWTTIRDTDGAFAPFVDFERRFVVAFTLPDDACPDRLVQFRSSEDATQERIIWEPQFEPPPGGCDQPLITRTYVVSIDRPLVDVEITFRLPGDETFGYETSELTITVERALVTVQLGDSATGADAPSEPDLVATDVVLPLPLVGEPRLHVGTFGIVWVVQHEDGTVSVVDAVVPEAPNEDDGGVQGLGQLVRPTENGTGFVGQRYIWDAHGRTMNGPRTADLVGYAGAVVDGEVQLFLSNATAIDGEPDDPDVVVEATADLSNLPLLDLDVLPTLSFSGPIWRRLDATLVVEGGAGRLCRVDANAPVPDLVTCGDEAVGTAITSTNPDITSWFFGPVLAEFDDFGEITTVAPLGGRASRNEAVVEQPEPEGFGGDFDVLWTGPSDLPLGTLFAASDQTTLGTWLSAQNARVEGPQPIDFERSIGLVVAHPDDACPDELSRFATSEDGRLVPVFTPPEGACRLPLVSQAYVVAVDRDSLPTDVVFALPADSGFEYDDAASALTDVGRSGDVARDLVRRPGPDGPERSALAFAITKVTTECPIGEPARLVIGATAAGAIDVIIDVIGGGIVRGSTTTTLKPGATTEATMTMTDRLDAGQKIVARSAKDDSILQVLEHVGCG